MIFLDVLLELVVGDHTVGPVNLGVLAILISSPSCLSLLSQLIDQLNLNFCCFILKLRLSFRSSEICELRVSLLI